MTTLKKNLTQTGTALYKDHLWDFLIDQNMYRLGDSRIYF